MRIEWIDNKYPVFIFNPSQKIMSSKKRVVVGPFVFLSNTENTTKKMAYCLAHASLFYKTHGLHCIKKIFNKDYRYDAEVMAFAEEILESKEKDKISEIYNTVDYMCDNDYLSKNRRGWAIVRLADLTHTLDGIDDNK